MYLLRILLFAVLGLAAAPSFAVPVRFTLEADDLTVWDYAFHDENGSVISGVVSDADGDGLETFVADVDPGQPNVYIHSTPSTSVCLVLLLVPGQADGPFPVMRDATGNPLIVASTGAPTGSFAVGQTLTATDGITAGLEGVVYDNPGIQSAADLLATGIAALPTYTGGAVVSALVSYEVVPEPASWLLLLGGAMAMAGCRRMDRRVVR
jgi:hypothetical protein